MEEEAQLEAHEDRLSERLQLRLCSSRNKRRPDNRPGYQQLLHGWPAKDGLPGRLIMTRMLA